MTLLSCEYRCSSNLTLSSVKYRIVLSNADSDPCSFIRPYVRTYVRLYVCLSVGPWTDTREMNSVFLLASAGLFLDLSKTPLAFLHRMGACC